MRRDLLVPGRHPGKLTVPVGSQAVELLLPVLPVTAPLGDLPLVATSLHHAEQRILLSVALRERIAQGGGEAGSRRLMIVLRSASSRAASLVVSEASRSFVRCSIAAIRPLRARGHRSASRAWMTGAAAVSAVSARSSMPDTADRLSTRRNVPSSRSQPPAYRISSCSRMPSLPTRTNLEYAPTSVDSSVGSSLTTAVTRCRPVWPLHTAARSSRADMSTSGWPRCASTMSCLPFAACASKVTGRRRGSSLSRSSFSSSPSVARAHDFVSAGTSYRPSVNWLLVKARAKRLLAVQLERGVDQALDVVRRDLQLIDGVVQVAPEPSHLLGHVAVGGEPPVFARALGWRSVLHVVVGDLAEHTLLHGLGEDGVDRAEVLFHPRDLDRDPGQELKIGLVGVVVFVSQPLPMKCLTSGVAGWP